MKKQHPKALRRKKVIGTALLQNAIRLLSATQQGMEDGILLPFCKII